MDIIIDTHCHPQFPQYDSDRDEVIRRATDAGVQMVCVGTDLTTSRRAIELAEQHEGVWASVGIHPNDISDFGSFIEVSRIVNHPKVVAIGEVGLDYYRTPDVDSQAKQKELLKKFIDLAVQCDKPLIIHCRDTARGSVASAGTTLREGEDNHHRRASAHADLLEMLPGGRGVIHSFTGTLEQAQGYIEKGYHIGLNAIVTFSEEYGDMVRGLPLERILLETDSPYLAPEPYRGKRNEPFYIIETAKNIAKMRNTPVNELILATLTNAKYVFVLM